MDLRQLRYFVGIIQAGSLSRAADQLRVAQSALSHHLASLESELQRQLVTRGGKGIELTEAGRVLYRHAEAILRQVESAKREAIGALNVPSGRVSIGFPAVLAPLLGYELLRRLRSLYPEILLHLSDANNWLLRERLLNGRLDMAMLFADRRERGLDVEPLLHEELFYVTADPDTAPIRIADVARGPLLMSGLGGSSRRVTELAFQKRGLNLTSIGEIDALGTLRRAVAAGIGNTILPWCALHGWDDGILLNYRPVIDAKLTRTVALCFSEVGQRSQAVNAVAETLRTLVRELVDNGTWQGVTLIDNPGKPSRSAAPRAKLRIGRVSMNA